MCGRITTNRAAISGFCIDIFFKYAMLSLKIMERGDGCGEYGPLAGQWCFPPDLPLERKDQSKHTTRIGWIPFE
jgi:hypothetical protein